jgi:hypothetical protein
MITILALRKKQTESAQFLSTKIARSLVDRRSMYGPNHHTHPSHPRQPEISSVASSPFSNAPAPFYIGGGSYTPSEGGNLIGLVEEPFEVSPPFQIPCVGLLSTSPCTGPGSVALLREQLLIGNTKASHGKTKGVASLSTTQMLSLQTMLPELPESPFDSFSKDDRSRVDRDSGQGSSGGLLRGEADTECMFHCEDDDDDEMPFAWAQASSDPSHLDLTDTASPFEQSFSKPNQSIIAQQCLAPPVLTGFESTALDGSKVSLPLIFSSDLEPARRPSLCQVGSNERFPFIFFGCEVLSAVELCVLSPCEVNRIVYLLCVTPRPAAAAARSKQKVGCLVDKMIVDNNSVSPFSLCSLSLLVRLQTGCETNNR